MLNKSIAILIEGHLRIKIQGNYVCVGIFVYIQMYAQKKKKAGLEIKVILKCWIKGS